MTEATVVAEALNVPCSAKKKLTAAATTIQSVDHVKQTHPYKHKSNKNTNLLHFTTINSTWHICIIEG